ncbi:MAG TPA: pantoate--beta-alanine ligase, partial [Micromonosporaceae bacterium]|nr:pantoate--beta-alanine ligase [Micromonosporaceae bacterium]
ALHDGHRALIGAASRAAEHTLVTIFVNPLQFGPNEDFDRYPRPFDADLAMCAALGVDVVFAPSVEEMYPNGRPQVTLDPGPRGEILEGASRPGFFRGVLTVVNKLLQLTRPDVTVFGEKDFQQISLVRQMVADLNLPVRVAAVPTDREPDGLARSSRNSYLTPEGRLAALALSTALRAGAAAGGQGPDAALSAATRAFAGTAGSAAEPVELDYLVLTAPDLGPAPNHGPARLLVAAWVGRDPAAGRPGTRLIDNGPVDL